MLCAGIDAGSRTIKEVVLDAATRRVAASGMEDQGVGQGTLAAALFDRVLREGGCARADVGGVVATGYGRNAVRVADTTITEITCQARGVSHAVPGARTVVDIGGQDSKLIRIEADGVAGVQRAIASRIGTMAGRGVEPPVLFTGGVALISGMDRALEAALGQPVTIAPDPQMTGALGAALLAAERCRHAARA